MIRICQTRAAKRSRRTLAAFRAPSAGMAGQAASFPMFASMREARNSGVVAEHITLRPAPL